MKGKVKVRLISFLVLISAAVLFTGCRDSLGRDGTISMRFDRESVSECLAGAATKGIVSVPDTSDFILTVTNAVTGGSVYEGPYSGRQSVLTVEAGTYLIKVVSEEFSSPEFDKPVFGDEQTVVVGAGENVMVSLECSRTNSGMILRFSERFKAKFSDYILKLSSDDGYLEYGLSETRTAYFNPGKITLKASSGLESVDVFSRTLAAGNVLTVKLDASSDVTTGTPQFRIYVDTSGVYSSVDIFYDGSGSAGGGDGSTASTALSVKEAGNHIDAEVWVAGYIVGGDCTSGGKISFSSPFLSQTNLAIADSASETDTAYCMTVELPLGDVRTALNLKDNPSRLGKKVSLFGKVNKSYFKHVGLKGVSEYELN